MSLKPLSQDQGTPLSPAPYFSRISTQEFQDPASDAPDNYVLIGFRPGYALQAAELNEIQEKFYLQQTLMATMISNWGGLGDPYGPGWGQNDAEPQAEDGGAKERNGLTPLSPSMISVNANTITFSQGWYLTQIPKFDTDVEGGQDKEINFKVWIYSSEDLTANISGAASAGGTYLGFDIVQEFITEEEDPGTPGDPGLGDPSNAVANTIPGATRYKLSVNGIVQNTSGAFDSITKASNDQEKTPFAVKVSSDGNGTIRFLNGRTIG